MQIKTKSEEYKDSYFFQEFDKRGRLILETDSNFQTEVRNHYDGEILKRRTTSVNGNDYLLYTTDFNHLPNKLIEQRFLSKRAEFRDIDIHTGERIEREINKLLEITEHSLDGKGRIIDSKNTNLETGLIKTTKFEFDELNRNIAIEEYEGSQLIKKRNFQYDGEYLVVDLTERFDSKKKILEKTHFVYDEQGNEIEEIQSFIHDDALTIPISRMVFKYNQQKQLIHKLVEENPSLQTYLFDEENTEIEEFIKSLDGAFELSTNYKFEYDSNGNEKICRTDSNTGYQETFFTYWEYLKHNNQFYPELQIGFEIVDNYPHRVQRTKYEYYNA